MARYRVVVLCVVALLTACTSEDSASLPDRPVGEQVVFEAFGIATASAQDLDRAAAIVQERLRALDVRNAVVRVRGQTLVATGTDIADPATEVLQPGVLEFRPVLALLPPASPAFPDGAVDESRGLIVPSRPGNGAGIRFEVGPAVLNGPGIEAAKAELIGGPDGWVITLSLNREGSGAFNELARTSSAKPPPENAVAIVLDGVVQSAPAFQTNHFEGGEVQISGTFTEAEADALAVVLRFGSLPVPLRLATR